MLLISNNWPLDSTVSSSHMYKTQQKRKNVSVIHLKILLHQGLSEPEFNGDLVYKFKKDDWKN